MRNYFQEGDLLVAEVQQIGSMDGAATLHTRSLKYGKLRNGLFLAVSGTGGGNGGVVRSRRQVWTVQTAHGGGEVSVVLGVNGFIWLAKHTETEPTAPQAQVSISNLEDSMTDRMYSSENDDMSRGTRQEIARLASCIKILAEQGIRVDEETVVKSYETALELEAESTDTGDGDDQLDEHKRRRIVEAVRDLRIVELG